MALKNLDEIINLIRNSSDVEAARERLMKRYKLSELQANAILEMQLRRLAALERKKIETEYKEITGLIKDLESLLKSPKRMRGVAAQELLRVKEAYGDRRRTQIVSLKAGKERKSVLTAMQTLPEQFVWITMDKDGMVCRTHEDKAPRLSGSEAPALLVRASSRDTFYLAAANGKAAAVAVHTLPEAEKPSDGVVFNKVSPLKADELPVAAFSLPAQKSMLPEETCVLTVTRGGMLKKSLISELPGPSSQTFALCRVNDGDALGWVALTEGTKEILLATALGMAIRFNEDDIRPMGLVAAGVNGVKLGVGDEVVGCVLLPAEGDVLAVASDGKAKRIIQKEFPLQGRYGRGVILWDLPLGIKLAGLALGKGTHVITLHLLKAAPKMTRLDEAGLKKRAATRGDVVVEVKPGDTLLSVTDAWEVGKFVELKKSEEKREKGEGEKDKSEEGRRKKEEGGKRGAAMAAKRPPVKPAAKAKKPAATASAKDKKPAAKKPAPRAKKK